MAENGVVSYLTTDAVLIDYLTFLHYGNPDQGEGVSVVFRAGNAAIGNEVSARKYVKAFRGSAGLRPGKCVIDGDCDVGEKCCASGQCVPSANSCTPVSPVCNTVADCDTAIFYPQCDTTAGACDWNIPECDSGACKLRDVGPCGTCTRCGDGVIDPMSNPSEVCDDGNADNTDACTTLCQPAACGDGYYQPDGADGAPGGGDDEACDDGNSVDGDGCSALCTLEDLCVGGTANGTQEGDEECDTGDPPADGTCDANCCLTFCGDGTVQSPNGQGLAETCEQDSDCAGGEFCSGCKCIADSLCGNGIREGTEECDDGKRCTDNGDPCQNNSDCNAGGTCVGRNIDGCTTPNGGGATCGNNIIETGETCDDGCPASTPGVCETPADDDDNNCTSTCTTKGSCSSPACTNSNCSATGNTWTLTVAGVASNGGICPDEDCSRYNVTNYNLDPNTDLYCESCDWCWLGSGQSTCDGSIDWHFAYRSDEVRWVLMIGASKAYYILNDSEWNCSGPNTMQLISSNSDCTGWPASVILTPSGSRSCS